VTSIDKFVGFSQVLNVRVGSFSHQGEIRGLFHGTVHTLKPADRPMPLPRAATEPAYRWQVDQTPGLTVDDFLARQRIMGLMIVKDGIVQVERYQYDFERGGVDSSRKTVAYN